MFDIQIAKAAERDLEEIHGYLQNELFNPLASENLREATWKAFETLTENPYAYAACQDARLARLGYRKCVVRNYLFIYRVNEADQIVNVVRFFHGSQDWVAQM